MSEKEYFDHKLVNMAQTLLLLISMAALLGLIGWVVAGVIGVFLAASFGVGVLLFTPAAPPNLVMKMARARPVSRYEAPEIADLLVQLAQRAGLRRAPRLHYLPTSDLNAFASGNRDYSAIAVSHGLLRRLDMRELFGVLAHEISHIRNGDVRVMSMASLFNRITSMFSMFGQVLLFLQLPLIFFMGQQIPWALILTLMLAPTAAGLLQLALSRTREFDADMSAARLTNDPHGLASALAKLEQRRGGFFEQIFQPMRRADGPTWLRTHPKTEERIDRLMSLIRRPRSAGDLHRRESPTEYIWRAAQPPRAAGARWL